MDAFTAFPAQGDEFSELFLSLATSNPHQPLHAGDAPPMDSDRMCGEYGQMCVVA
ncbi:hypothetical protein BDN72DRAFT_845707 [Pluteus cervinus]|uniref:Uncharacterized protein n=1 Tax=Pluteus cervinus TaxID=181527 RepID=A0ACD3AHE1_9AGAR|nr:hypothetical protein BDN72DRAFT_845707 [Pluteus cervinus]